jgi:hypothetical protein
MPAPLALRLINHLGLIGAAGSPTGSLVPKSASPQSLQYNFQDFAETGKIADVDIWSRYSSMMKRPVSFDSMLNLWEEMAGWDLIAAALSETVHEALQTDAHCPGTLWYECNDAEFEDELNAMAQRVRVEDFIPSQVYNIAGMGNAFEKLEYEPGNGVVGMSFAHPMDVRRYWLERNRRCVGFRWNLRKPRKDDAFVGLDNVSPIQRVSLNAGQEIEHLWYPWDFMHMRRMFRLRMTEHGEPIFEEAQGIYKKLRLALDQMVVHRAQVQPDRYVVNIDVKDQAPMEQMRTVNRWKQSLRSKLSFGSGTDALSDPTKMDAFYNAMALDTILWMAKPNGFNHTIEKMAGTANVPDVYDIELLTDLFYSIIGMPKSWFGATKDSGDTAPSGKSLLAQDMRFLRKIKTIRRPVVNGYTWLGYFHAVLKGKNINDLEIRAKMAPIGSLEDQMKLELLSSQADVLDKLGDIMSKYNLPREAWIDAIFKRYLHLPDDVVNVFLAALPAETSAQQESQMSAPTTFKLINEITQKLSNDADGLRAVKRLKSTLYGDQDLLEKAEDRRLPRFRDAESVFEAPSFKDDDLIVSSYGQDPFQFRAPVGTPSSATYHTMPQVQKLVEGKVQKPAPVVLVREGVSRDSLKAVKVAEKPVVEAQKSKPGYWKYVG